MSNIYDFYADGSTPLKNFSDLTGARSGSTRLVYPDGLGQTDSGITSGESRIPFIVFSPYRVTGAAALSSLAGTQGDVITTLPPPSLSIVLPLTSDGLSTSYSVAYTTPSLNKGWAGSVLTGLAQIAKSVGSDGKPNYNSIDWGSLGASTLTQEFIGLVGKSGESPQTLLNAAFKIGGIALNPYEEVMFDKVNFRTHKFTYLFTPRNLGDSKKLDAIIQAFRFYMMPAYSTGGPVNIMGNQINFTNLLGVPFSWQITQSVADTTFLILPSVLESCDVDYSGGQGGTPAFFYADDGTRYPAQVSMSLTFKETFILTRDRLLATEGIPASDKTGTLKRFRF